MEIIVTASADNSIILWGVDLATRRKTLSGNFGAVSTGAFSPDGMILATALHDGTVILHYGVPAQDYHHSVAGSYVILYCAPVHMEHSV